ncbi:MAG: prolyl oligopeptidase family serine peptidase, partial [Oscillospiraceae bacterium]|nr:prolyl oligopeptidase family serine peptidase [Oscillospiraceae bacterium]
QQTVPMKLLVSLLQNEILENYAIDPDRIYVTGISAGGFATWDLICRYPDLFAAAIPVCGGCDVNYAEAIKDIPIRIYHSSDDTIVSDAGSRQMYEELKKLGADVEFYDTKPWGHGAWGKAYAEKDLLSWMMSKVRPVRPDNTETVTTAELTETANPESSGSRLEEAVSSDGIAETETNGMTGLWVIVVSCVIVFAVAAVIFVSVKKAGKKKRT